MWPAWASGRRPPDGLWPVLAGAALLAALCWLAYGNAVDLGFTYDDEDYLANARQAQGHLGLLVHPDLATPWASRLGVHAYFYLLYRGFGAAPAAYHLASIVLHWVNALLLWRLVFLHHQRNRQRLMLGMAAALLFVLTPAYYHAVFWVSAVSLVLGMTFLLGALLAARRYVQGGGGRWLGLATVAYACSPLLHQAYAATAWLPALLSAGERSGRRRALGAAATFAVPALAAVALERWLFHGAYTGQQTYRLWGLHVPVNLLAYTYELMIGSWLAAARVGVAASVRLGLGAVGLAALALAVRRVDLRLWAAWVVVAVLPFVPWERELVFSRYLYAPGPAACVLVGGGVVWLVEWLRRRGRRMPAVLVATLAAAVVIGAGITQVRRLQSVPLYDEGKYLLFVRRDPARAIGRLEAALRRDDRAPAKVSVWLAWAWHLQGDDARARRLLDELLRREPGLEQARLLRQRLAEPSALPTPPPEAWPLDP